MSPSPPVRVCVASDAKPGSPDWRSKSSFPSFASVSWLLFLQGKDLSAAKDRKGRRGEGSPFFSLRFAFFCGDPLGLKTVSSEISPLRGFGLASAATGIDLTFERFSVLKGLGGLGPTSEFL